MKTVHLAMIFFFMHLPYQAANSQATSRLTNEQRDNISARYAMCSAYFNIVGAGMNKSGEAEIAKIHRDLAVSMMKQSFELAASNRTPEMTERVVVARYGLHQEAMLEEIGRDFTNISIIMKRFGKECAMAASNQREFVRTYIEANR